MTTATAEVETWNLDDSPANAEWTKQSWDFPAYKSKKFFEQVPVDQLDEFRKTSAYAAAVAQGLIHDDEWVADFVEEA